jgi:hypothetical protein
LLDLEFCPSVQAIVGDGHPRFQLQPMLSYHPIHRPSAEFSDAFACKRIDLLTTIGFAKKSNAHVESLGSELKSVIYYVAK